VFLLGILSALHELRVEFLGLLFASLATLLATLLATWPPTKKRPRLTPGPLGLRRYVPVLLNRDRNRRRRRASIVAVAAVNSGDTSRLCSTTTAPATPSATTNDSCRDEDEQQ
jgi:hypothetical protein